MWPEPSVSCLISRPLPGSPGQPTSQRTARPREGLAEKENHFSRLARPGPAFLPRPCPRSGHRKRAGASHPEVPPSGTGPVWEPRHPSSLSAEALWFQSQLSPRRAVPASLLCVCQVSCLQFGPGILVVSLSTHPHPPGHFSQGTKHRGCWA